jgi:hypothetical protein
VYQQHSSYQHLASIVTIIIVIAYLYQSIHQSVNQSIASIYLVVNNFYSNY